MTTSTATKNPFQNFIVKFENGRRVFDEGQPGLTMYIVQSGSVRLFRETDDQVREMGVMEKGDFFGEMSVLEGLPRTHSAETLEDTDLIEINSTTFDKMIRSNIEIAVRMLRKLSIRLREAERKAGASPASAAIAPPVPDAGRREETLMQVHTEGLRLVSDSDGTTFHLHPAETLIGRYDPVTEVRPDIDLTEVDLKRSVSRRHARVLGTPGGWSLIEEVGALNGTFVNSDRLTPGEPHELNDGDSVSFGMVKMTFRT